MPVNMTLMIESEMKVALGLVFVFLGREGAEGSFFWRLAFGAEEREGSRSSSTSSVLGLGLFPPLVVVPPVFPFLDPVFVVGAEEEIELESIGARAGLEDGKERGVEESESVSLGGDLEGSFSLRGSCER